MRKELKTKDQGPRRGWSRIVMHDRHGVAGVTGWYADDVDAIAAADRAIESLLSTRVKLAVA